MDGKQFGKGSLTSTSLTLGRRLRAYATTCSLWDIYVSDVLNTKLDGCLLLLDSNATRRVDKITTRFTGMVDRVNSSKEQLLLKVRELDKILLISVCLDRRVLGDDTSTCLLSVRVRQRDNMWVLPEQGASSNTLSNPPITLGNSRAS